MYHGILDSLLGFVYQNPRALLFSFSGEEPKPISLKKLMSSGFCVMGPGFSSAQVNHVSRSPNWAIMHRW